MNNLSPKAVENYFREKLETDLIELIAGRVKDFDMPTVRAVIQIMKSEGWSLSEKNIEQGSRPGMYQKITDGYIGEQIIERHYFVEFNDRPIARESFADRFARLYNDLRGDEDER